MVKNEILPRTPGFDIRGRGGKTYIYLNILGIYIWRGRELAPLNTEPFETHRDRQGYLRVREATLLLVLSLSGLYYQIFLQRRETDERKFELSKTKNNHLHPRFYFKNCTQLMSSFSVLWVMQLMVFILALYLAPPVECIDYHLDTYVWRENLIFWNLKIINWFWF